MPLTGAFVAERWACRRELDSFAGIRTAVSISMYDHCGRCVNVLLFLFFLFLFLFFFPDRSSCDCEREGRWEVMVVEVWYWKVLSLCFINFRREEY